MPFVNATINNYNEKMLCIKFQTSMRRKSGEDSSPGNKWYLNLGMQLCRLFLFLVEKSKAPEA